MRTRTTQEIADALGVPKEAAAGLVKFLQALDLAKFRGERPSPSGKGKGAHVYEIEDGAGDKVAEKVKELE